MFGLRIVWNGELAEFLLMSSLLFKPVSLFTKSLTVLDIEAGSG